MRKIDPKELLDCLGTLLGKKGGIKGESEVKRMADLMTKFSKKLVSKCIYIQILKNTDPDLLMKFMAEGGWALIFQWLAESIENNNYALIREILELLLICPISLDRLKENNCPKVVKSLSKEAEVEEVKRLACKLVEKWLKFIKSGRAAFTEDISDQTEIPRATISVTPSSITVGSTVSSSTITTNDIKKVSSVSRKISKSNTQIMREVSPSEVVQYDSPNELVQYESSSDVGQYESSSNKEDEEEMVPIGSLPLFKITVKDGKSVLAKVGTKSLTSSISTKSECETDTSTITSYVLKSDPITKKFRYVPKTVTEKEKSSGNESLRSETINREKSDIQKSEDTVRTVPLVCMKLSAQSDSDKSPTECDSLEPVKSKNNEGLLKSIAFKSVKEGKVKDSVKSSKTHKDRDSIKYKSKEKKENKDAEKEKRRSEHKNHSSDKGKDKDRDKERERSKNKESSKDKHKDSDKSKSRDKDGKSKDNKDSKFTEKSLTAAEKAQIQADKDKDTLERIKTPTLSILGKIPKKSSSSLPSNTETTLTKSSSNRSTDSASSEKVSKSNSEVKKVTVDTRTPKGRPKTVKTFNSKFRSTGLEEEIKPPPSRNNLKKKLEEKRPLARAEGNTKYSAVARDEPPPEKKSKVSEILADIKKEKVINKPGAIKLIPPKPKPALLESDMFSDALTASTKLEPRKRKRRVSVSREAAEVKKEIKDESAQSQELPSPKEMKPSFKFYRDTLEDDEEKNKENVTDIKSGVKTESDNEDPSKSSSSNEEPSSKLYPNGVLIYKTKKGPKKSVKWKEEPDLTTIKYFELDENERVNVTRNFVDMKLMERSHEREAFQLARKLATDDVMEERIPWGPLYEVDVPSDRQPAVEPGNASQEKSVQYAREKTVLQAIYFHRDLIPDSPAEPDVEIHPTTDPKIIPLEDITGNCESVANFQNIPWPEPKPAIIPTSPPPPQQQIQHPLQPQQQQSHPQGFTTGYATVGNFTGFPTMGIPGVMPPGQNTWRAGEGKDAGMNMNFQPNGPMCPPMNQQPGMFTPHPPEGFNMNGPPMGNFASGFPMNCEPNMYGPPPPVNMGGPPPPQWNRGWQQGGRGGGHFMQGSMAPKFQKGVCHHFAKFGNCARGNTCRFIHPN